MPAQTLRKLATQAAIRVYDIIFDFADMPYEMAHPILQKIQDPHQLEEIEKNNPQMADSTEELWKSFIARDIPNWEEKMCYPKNPRSWGKVYHYMMREEKKRIAADEEVLRKSMQSESLKKARAAPVYVEKVLPHPRAEDETNFYIDGVKRSQHQSQSGSGWGEKKPTLKNAKTGRDAIAAIRRQNALAANARASAKPMLSADRARNLDAAKRQIKVAPESMLRANKPVVAERELTAREKAEMAERKRIMNSLPTNRVVPPKTRVSNLKMAQRNATFISDAANQARAANEDRLRALTQPKKKTPMTTTAPKPVQQASPLAATAKSSSVSAVTPKHSAPANTTAAASPKTAQTKPAIAAAGPSQSSAEKQVSAPSVSYMPAPSPNERKRKLIEFEDDEEVPVVAEAAKSTDTAASPVTSPPATGAQPTSPPASSPPRKVMPKPKVNIFMTNKKRKF